MFNKTFTGPSHIALYFWGFLHSYFVLFYAAGKIVDLSFFFVFVFGINLSCRHFSKFCDSVWLCYASLFWINCHTGRAKLKKKTYFSLRHAKNLLCLNIIWHNLNFITSPQFFWYCGEQNYPHPQVNFLWPIWQDLCAEKYT